MKTEMHPATSENTYADDNLIHLLMDGRSTLDFGDITEAFLVQLQTLLRNRSNLCTYRVMPTSSTTRHRFRGDRRIFMLAEQLRSQDIFSIGHFSRKTQLWTGQL